MSSFVNTDVYGSKALFQINSQKLLAVIKEMIEENEYAQKNFYNTSDYIDGRQCALRELAVELKLCDYEDLL